METQAGMNKQLQLFEVARLNEVKKHLEKMKRLHQKSSKFDLILDRMIGTIGDYQRCLNNFSLTHPDFSLERISCFTEIMIQSLVSASIYSSVGCDFLTKTYGEADFNLIPNYTRDALLKFWLKEEALKPRLKFAIDGGWDGDRAFIRLLRL